MLVKLTVEGMSCDSCEQTVEKAVTSVSGVTQVTVDRSIDQVMVEGDDLNKTTHVHTVEGAGYTTHA